MSYIVGFGKFWYHFVVGDDWMIAAAVVIGLVVTYLLAHDNVPAWWLMPIAAIAILGVSVMRGSKAG